MTQPAGTNERIERRRAKGRELCRKLTSDIAAIAPPGLGLSPAVWKAVESASGEFLDLLARWEIEGDRSLLTELQAKYDAVVDAWRAAAVQQLGRPSQGALRL